MVHAENIVDQSRKLLGVIALYTGKMPREFRFTIGDRLLTRTLSVLECVVEAYYSKPAEKYQLIRRANIHLEISAACLPKLQRRKVGAAWL